MYLNFSSCLPCPVDETVYDYRAPEPSKPLHRSQFAHKVRVDRWCCKSGQYQTIGPPPLRCPKRPQNFLKKHSRLPPVFFGSEDLKSHPKPKTQPPPPPRPKYKPSRLPGLIKKCPYPLPPRNMGLFRGHHDPPYEDVYRLNKVKREGICCKYATVQCPCECSHCRAKANYYQSPPNNYDANQCYCNDCYAIPNYDHNSANYNTNQCYNQCGNVTCYYFPQETSATSPRKESNRSTDNTRNKGQKKKPSVAEERDFLHENAVHAVRMSCSNPPKFYIDERGNYTVDLRRSSKDGHSGPYVLKPGYGEVPKYLEKRKEEIREQQCIRSCQKPTTKSPPPGCQRMERSERASLIKGIKETRDTYNSDYLSLLNEESSDPKSDQKKGELEAKIKECELDLKLLSSPEELYVEIGDDDVLLFHT